MIMENRLSFDDGVRKISIYNEEEELLTVLRINVADADTARRFVELIQNLEQIADSGSGMADVFKEKYKEYESQSFDDLPDDVKMDIIVDASKVRIDVLNRMIAEIDALFGKDTIRNIFCGIAQFILRILGRRDLSIVHKILHLVFGTNQRRLHTLGGNSRFVKDLDVLDVFLGFNLTQSYRPLSERVS